MTSTFITKLETVLILYAYEIDNKIADGTLRLNLVIKKTGYHIVEVYHYGFWGGISANTTALPEATVICRQLGYRFATQFSCCPPVPRRKIWISRLKCLGNESKITDCRMKYGVSKDIDTLSLLQIKCHGKI